MRLSAGCAEDVLDAYASRDECICDQRAMATPGNCFGAHDRRCFFGGDFDECVDRRCEFRRLHVICKSPEAGIFPAGINAVARGVAQTAKLFHRSVINARCVERFGQHVRVELRIVARTRNGADIHDTLDTVRFQEANEFLDGPVRMADCEYSKRTVLRRGAFLRGPLLFGVRYHPMYISGAVRASGRI